MQTILFHQISLVFEIATLMNENYSSVYIIVVVFLDFKRAFQMVSRSRLLHKHCNLTLT